MVILEIFSQEDLKFSVLNIPESFAYELSKNSVIVTARIRKLSKSVL